MPQLFPMNARRNQTQRFTAHRVAVLCLTALFLLSAWVPQASWADGRSSLSISPSPEVILADGRSQTTITATVRDGSGNLAPNGTDVNFSTSLGTLDHDNATTMSGVARVMLTSSISPGTATVTATSLLPGGAGSSTGSGTIEFTSDRDAVYTSGDSRWIQVECPQDVIYSADDKIIEAHGKNASALLHFRGLEVSANALQLGVNTEELVAHDATLKRGKYTLKAYEMRYNLGTNIGSAVVPGIGRQAVQSVAITGYNLHTEPLDAATVQASVQTNLFRFQDISSAHVIVAARAMSADPGDQIQFRRASIFSDGKRVISMPYHVMSMNSDELFGQQLIGFGSEGFFVNVPFYYHVDPHSTGTLFLRNSAVAGSSSVSTALPSSYNQDGTRPGLALDLQHSYTLGHSGTGQLSVNGITRSDWGAQWNHTQKLDASTTTYTYVDFPEHRSLYGSSNVSRQFNGFSMNVTATGSEDPGYLGYSSQSETVSAYLQTTAHQIGQSGINMVTDLTVQKGQLSQTAPDQPRQIIPVSTRGVDMRFYTAPFRPDRHTSITDSVTVGESLGAGSQFAPNVLGTVGLTRSTFGHGSLNMNYTYRYDPLLSQLGSSTDPTSALGTLYQSSIQQRLSVGYSVTPIQRLSVSLNGGYGLPLQDADLFTLISYRFNKDWGLGINSFFDRYASASYHETEFDVTRRLFGRDLVFTYSTLTKKVRFDLAASGL